MQIKNIALQLFVATTCLAQLQAVQNVIGTVQNQLGKLDGAVKAIADANTAAAVAQVSAETQDVIKKGTADLQKAQALSLQEALGLQDTAQKLQTAVQSVVQDLVAKKTVLDGLGATQQAIQTLKDQKTSSAALGNVIVSKVPAIGQGIAQQQIGQISTIIDNGITQLGGTPNKRRSVRLPLVV